MGKGKIGGKYSESGRKSRSKAYKMVAIDKNGNKVIVRMEAPSERSAISKVKSLGYPDIVKDSAMPEPKFDSVASTVEPPTDVVYLTSQQFRSKRRSVKSK